MLVRVTRISNSIWLSLPMEIVYAEIERVVSMTPAPCGTMHYQTDFVLGKSAVYVSHASSSFGISHDSITSRQGGSAEMRLISFSL